MRLHLKAGLILLMMGLVPLLTMWVHVLLHLDDAVRESANRSLSALSLQVSKDIQRVVNEGMRSLQLLARQEELGRPSTDPKILQRELYNALHYHPHIKNITVLDTRGRMRVTLAHTFRGDWAETIWFQRALKGRSGFYGAHAQLYPFDVVMTASAPLIDPDQHFVSGVVVAHLDMEAVWDVVTGVDLGPGGRAMIVNDQGIVVASSDPSQNLLSMQNRSLREQLHSAPRGMVHSEFMGVPQVGAFAIVDSNQRDDIPTGWRVLLLQPRERAYAGLFGMQRSLLLAGALSLIAVGVLSFFFSRLLQRWLEIFTEVLQRLGNGDFKARIPVRGRDEIAELGNAVNRTALELQKTDQQLRHYQQGLEQQVRDRTADLEHAKNEAEQANRAKDEFLASMSHEIRTPLNAITGLTEIVLQGQLSHGQRDALGTVLDSSEHLLNVIDDILDFSLVEANRLQLDISDFNLHGLLRSVISTLRLQAETKQLRLELEIDPDTPQFVRGDPGRLRQVLFNLAGNALKFTGQGVVRVQAGPGPTHIQEATEPETQTVLFSVQDTGPGIPPDAQQIIFDSFQRGAHTGDPARRGTGLGLSISRRLVELMQGSIWVSSTPGQGSEFYFTVKLERGDPARTMVPQHPTSPLLPQSDKSKDGFAVLVAEDNPVNVKVVSLLLEKMGCSPVVVDNGQAALDTLARQSFDIVLMDVEMPGMDGLEATRRIRQGVPGETPRDVPIIALTAHTTDEIKRACFQAGMDDFLPKPVRLTDLTEIMKRFRPTRTAGSLSATMIPEATPPLPSADHVPTSGKPDAEASSTPVTPARLDSATAMVHLGIDQNTYISIFDSALKEAEKRLQGTRQALSTGDMDALRRHAHTMKSSAGSIGAEQFQNWARELETAAAAGDESRAELLIRQLEAEAEALHQLRPAPLAP
ncbi:Signal transduction histidine kinase [Paucidesulfovibrio gracilis DSM 16080]|uniref:histidine kinase n=1 Tax=Paucidesulfovibrio gracilis DSM 16080 TaxID=1121449 RepID=A0A1T4W4B9_9BACT|nr:hybrid sensor histidine kinase/response regulator [Paucidesulfovibrio gracilis]SKA72096.1 Signal transduction histidine kinase [Paucidesulfovibrio gracilis DSM 16080]